MKNRVQILFNFDDEWKDLIFADIVITDFKQAIKLVQVLGIKYIQLRQDDKENGGTLEWDNF